MVTRVRFLNQACPVCGYATGKCSTTDTGLGIICWYRREVSVGTELGGFVCTKESRSTAGDMGSVWFPPELAFTKSPAERLRAIYAKTAYSEELERPDPVEAMPLVGRDVFVSRDVRNERHLALLERFRSEGLFRVSANHAMQMADRLHDENWERVRSRMSELGFLSVASNNKRVKLEDPVPGAVATSTGWEVRLQKGLYCPMRDSDGLLLGWEFRADSSSSKGSRYRVLSKGSDGSRDACPIVLPENGEQPINWCRPPQELGSGHPPGGYPRLVLVEGKGIKPQVVAWRFGLPVLGCGGSMAGARSPEQLLAAVETLMVPGGELVLFADCGWAVNPMVTMAMAETVGVLEERGFVPVVASTRAWDKEGGTERLPKREVRTIDDEVFRGSDPDELEPYEFWDCLRNAKPLREWLEHERTPQDVVEAAQRGLEKVIEADQQDDHIRREEAASRRQRHVITPRLMASTMEAKHFEPGEQTPAVIAAVKANAKAAKEDYEAWLAERLPELEQLVASTQAVEDDYPALVEALKPLLVQAKRLGVELTALEELGATRPQDLMLRNLEGAVREAWEQLRETGSVEIECLYPSLPRLVFDTSETGTGKTHGVAENSEQLRVAVGGERQGAVIYVSRNYRSPSVAALSEWTEVPARHGGLIAAEAPNGGVRVVRAPEGTPPEDLIEEANCAYAHRFAQIIDRGHGVEAVTKWCRDFCPHRPASKKGGGDDTCEWAHEMRELVNEVVRPDSTRSQKVHRLRTSTDGLIGLSTYGAGFIDKALVVIDETDQLSDAVAQTIEINQSDLAAMRGLLRRWPEKDRELGLGFIDAFTRLLDAPPEEKGKDHGIGVADCRRHKEIQLAVQAMVRAYSEDGELVLPRRWMHPQKLDRNIGSSLLAALDSDSETSRTAGVASTPMDLLADLLRAVMPTLPDADGQSVVVNAEGGKRSLLLARRRPEFSSAVAASATTLVLDATARPEDVLTLLGFGSGRAHAEVVQARGVGHGAEVVIKQVPCLGAMGRLRRPSTSERRDDLIDTWAAAGPGPVGVLDHKRYCRSGHREEQGWLTPEARGGNNFESVVRFMTIGLPITNLNAFEQQVELKAGSGTFTRDSEEFRRWLAHAVAIELIQARGRVREVQRDAGERIEWWVVSSTQLHLLCDQMGWPRPEVVELTEVLGLNPKTTATDEAFTAVERLLVEAAASGSAPPSSEKLACLQAKTNQKAFRRACKYRGTSYYSLCRQHLTKAA